jgi:1-acyl-sn-glycerol-3-phosphate acyltransferase
MATPRPSLGYRLLQRFLLGFFRTFYLLEVRGLEHIPVEGPVVIAGNHVNPFDALIMAACVPRRMRFVVWNRTFDKPVIGWLLRATGCIPINRDKPDLTAFKESLRWLETGNVLGIFPEGRYTETGHLDELKPGTARIAMAAKAFVVPATLTGAYHAWPLRGAGAKVFPRPWKIALKFHQRIRTTDTKRADAQELTHRIADAINSTLEPAVRAEEKVKRLVERPASHVRIYEWALCFVLLATSDVWASIVAGVYFAYLLSDIYLVCESPASRALRNFSPALALAAAYPSLLKVVGPPPRGMWIASYVGTSAWALWMMISYCFRKYLQFQRLVRGLLLCVYACLLQLIFMRALPRASLVVTVSLFALFFDWAHNRMRFGPAAMIVGVPLVVAIVFESYPAWAVVVNALTVGVVFAYMHILKFRAHDGRRI